MTEQEQTRKINHLETFVDNANSYANSLERRIADIEKHNRTFLTLYITGVILLIFTIGALILVAQ